MEYEEKLRGLKEREEELRFDARMLEEDRKGMLSLYTPKTAPAPAILLFLFSISGLQPLEHLSSSIDPLLKNQLEIERENCKYLEKRREALEATIVKYGEEVTLSNVVALNLLSTELKYPNSACGLSQSGWT